MAYDQNQPSSKAQRPNHSDKIFTVKKNTIILRFDRIEKFRRNLRTTKILHTRMENHWSHTRSTRANSYVAGDDDAHVCPVWCVRPLFLYGRTRGVHFYK